MRPGGVVALGNIGNEGLEHLGAVAFAVRRGAPPPESTLRRLGTNQIWITTDGDVNLPKPNVQLAQTGNNTNDSNPVWTNDGQYILFNQTNFEGTAPAWVMSIRYEERDAKQAVRVPIEPLPVVDISFSPDSYWIAFESWPEQDMNRDIYISFPNGANRTRLTTDPGDDFDPVWRPFPKPLN